MYVDIHARDASDFEQDRSKRGKSMWVNEPDFKMALRKGPASHLGNAPWHIEIKGETTEEKGGEFSYRATWRELQVQLTPSDLNKLFAFALEHGLLQISAAEAAK